MVYGHTVACPLHNWSIDLESGEAVAPDEGCSHRYPVQVENGVVAIAVSAAKIAAM
jgi:nitrite reductase (NADH) small subunit